MMHRKPPLSRERQPFFPAQAPLDAGPAAFQAFSNQLAHALVVVYHQYFFCHVEHPAGLLRRVIFRLCRVG
jgi:hypothetical protein